MGEDRKEAASLSRDKGGSPGAGEKWSREISGPPPSHHMAVRGAAPVTRQSRVSQTGWRGEESRRGQQ